MDIYGRSAKFQYEALRQPPRNRSQRWAAKTDAPLPSTIRSPQYQAPDRPLKGGDGRPQVQLAPDSTNVLADFRRAAAAILCREEKLAGLTVAGREDLRPTALRTRL